MYICNIFIINMIYQLPNGKVINLSIAEYLDLTDDDLKYLSNNNYGKYANSPWIDSNLDKKEKSVFLDNSIDFIPEDVDEHSVIFSEDELFEDDSIELPEDTDLI